MKQAEMTEILKYAGGPRAVAKALDLSTQAVYQWRKVPVKYLDVLETMSGISKRRLRPDLAEILK